MNDAVRQRGLTLFGLIFVLLVVGFVALLLIKCGPIYLNQIAIERDLREIANQATVVDGQVDVGALRSAIERRWDVDYINQLEPRDIKVVRGERGLTLSYDYEARAHLFYNVDLVIHFADDIPIRGGAG
jgi:hypothetical protein